VCGCCVHACVKCVHVCEGMEGGAGGGGDTEKRMYPVLILLFST
jgi:hypothetical protein